MKGFLTLFIVFTALMVAPWGYAQIDLNGNGTIDLPLTLVDNNQLRWFGQDLTTDEIFQLGLFGHPSYQVHVGHWVNQNSATRVYVRKNAFGHFELFSDNSEFGYQLGTSNSDATVILGRDIDSSGLQDAVLVSSDRRKWTWQFSFDPLSGSATKKGILYGSIRHIPFLFRARGQSDSLGLLKVRGKRAKISYRQLEGRLKRQVRFRGFTPPKEQPLLIRGSNGRDHLGFVNNGQFFAIDSRGKTSPVVLNVPKEHSIVIGDFNAAGEETVATFTEGKIVFADGDVKRLSDENIVPLSGKSSNSYDEAYVSPEIVPTVTRTATTAPTLFFADIPTLTFTPYYTDTPVRTLTTTALPTATITSAVSSSVTPTVSPVITSTPFPTYTYYPTYTPRPTTIAIVENTSTAYPTYTPFSTYTETAIPTITETFTPFPTYTPANTSTPYPAEPTYTPLPPQATYTPANTSTPYPVDPTYTPVSTPTSLPAEPTHTPLPPQATHTPVPPAATYTPVNTPTSLPAQATYTPANTPTGYPAAPTNTPYPAEPTYTPYPAQFTYTPIPTPTATPTIGASMFVSEWKTDNTTGSVSGSNQISLPLESDGTYNFTVDWGDGSSDTITSWNQAEVTHTYAFSGTYTVKISGTIEGFRFNNGGDRTKIIDISQWGILKLGNNGTYFSGCSQFRNYRRVSVYTHLVELTLPGVSCFKSSNKK